MVWVTGHTGTIGNGVAFNLQAGVHEALCNNTNNTLLFSLPGMNVIY